MIGRRNITATVIVLLLFGTAYAQAPTIEAAKKLEEDVNNPEPAPEENENVAAEEEESPPDSEPVPTDESEEKTKSEIESPSEPAPAPKTRSQPQPTRPTAQPQMVPPAIRTPPAQQTRPTRPSSRRNKKNANEGPLKKNEKGLVRLDFPQAEISDVAKAISELTQKNFIMDERVRGKITMISPTPVTVQEAYQAFVSALAVKNFTIIKSGKVHKIVQLRSMKNEAVPTETKYVPEGRDIYVTRLIPIEFIKAAELSKSLRGLISKNGDMISYDPTNTLIITESIGNLRRILKIVEKLDQKGFEESLEVIQLRFAPAVDTADKLRKIFDIQDKKVPGKAQGVDSGAREFISKIFPDERTNSLIVLANQAGVKKIRDVVEKLDNAIQANVEKGRIHVHYLQYADASELAGTLATLSGGSRPTIGSNQNRRNRAGSARTPQNTPASPGSRGGGTASLQLFGGDINITSDPPTNALVITAAPADYQALLPIIHRLDIRRPQAFIEAMIMEVDIDKAFDVGMAGNLGGQFGGTNPTSVFGATSFGADSSIALPTDPSAIQGLFLGLQSKTIDVPIAGGETLTIPIYGATFRTLQTNGTINVLSTPNILTSDNMEAEIVVGQVVPFITAQGRDVNNQPINQIQRENVAITLRVTPQINESDDVTMDIFQEIQDLIPGPDIELFGPTTSTRSAKTTVLVKDGQTVTVGGLIDDRQTNSVSKVPVLGDIPLLGWLFKSKSKSKRKTSLVIFITPHIIREPEDLQLMSVKKNLERQRFLKENNVKEHPSIQKKDLDNVLRQPLKRNKQHNTTRIPAGSPTGNFMSFGEANAEPKTQTIATEETSP